MGFVVLEGAQRQAAVPGWQPGPWRLPALQAAAAPSHPRSGPRQVDSLERKGVGRWGMAGKGLNKGFFLPSPADFLQCYL